MEVKDSILNNKDNSKNVYIEIDNDRYYAFQPQLEYFNLNSESQNIYDKSLKELEKAEAKEKQQIDLNNKKYSEQCKVFDEKMKISNIINTCITILFVILMFANTSSNIGVVFFVLSIIVPIVIHWCSKKYFEYGITYKYLSYPLLDQYKYVDKNLESNLMQFKRAKKLYEEYLSHNGFEKHLSEVDNDPDLSFRLMKHRVKMYCDFIEFTEFEETDDENIFIAKKGEKKFLIWINQIYDRQIHVIEEYEKLKIKFAKYPECYRAWMYINVNWLVPYGESDSPCAVVGEFEVARYLRYARDIRIFKKRCEYYGINDDSTIENNKCSQPNAFFYPNGNLKYYGDIEDIPVENEKYIKRPASNGYGVYLDENENIIKYGYFMKGEISDLSGESIYTPSIKVVENSNERTEYIDAFDFAEKEIGSVFQFEEFVVKTEQEFGYDIIKRNNEKILKKHNKKIEKDKKVIIYDIKNQTANGVIIVDEFTGNNYDKFKEIHSSCILAQYLLGHKVGEVVGKDENKLCDWGLDAYLIMQIFD